MTVEWPKKIKRFAPEADTILNHWFKNGFNEAIDQCRAAFDKAQKEEGGCVIEKDGEVLHMPIIEKAKLDDLFKMYSYKEVTHDGKPCFVVDVDGLMSTIEYAQKEKDGAGKEKICEHCDNEGGRMLFTNGTIQPGECGQCGRGYSQALCDKYNQEIMQSIPPKLSPATRLPTVDEIAKCIRKSSIGLNPRGIRGAMVYTQDMLCAELAQAIRNLLEKG